MTFNKRQREQTRLDRQREKELRRRQRRDDRQQRAPTEAGVDPDIAGIVPGPQPPLDDL